MSEPVFLGIGQVARLLNYCDNYVRRHEQQLGLTPTFTGGGHRRYPLDQALRAKQKVEERRPK
jgi:DNA-binding transcriptional MerR regulator